MSYTYNDFGKDFGHNVDILACLAQCSIDNAKKTFDVDIHSEIQRIKQEMNIKEFGYPSFMGIIKPEIRNKVNPNIVCPMNSVFKLKVGRQSYSSPAIPISEFFVQCPNTDYRKKSKAVEKLIEKYSLKLIIFRQNVSSGTTEFNYDDWILLRDDYESLLQDIKRITLSSKYQGLMAWMINRAFMITPNIQSNRNVINTKLGKNRPLLLKILYDLNSKMFKKCFKSSSPN